MAIGHALFANANRDRKKQRDPFTVRDFMPYAARDEFDEESYLASLIKSGARDARGTKTQRKPRTIRTKRARVAKTPGG